MSETSTQRERFTEGALLGPLLTLAAPLVATQLLQVLYNLTDTFWVGRLGADAVTALSFSWPVVFLLISLGGGFTMAGTVLVSQNTGAGNDDRIAHVAGQTLSFTGLLCIALSTLGYVVTPQLLALIGATPGTAVFDMAVVYTRTIFLGIYFMFGFFIFQALLRGWGDTKTPMYLTVASVALNVLIDPVFILGFQGNPLFGWLGLESLEASLYAATGFTGLGVQGAAIATVLSRGLAAAAGLWLLFGGRVGIHLSLADLRPEPATIRKLFRLGAPVSVENSTQAMSATVMTALVAVVSANAVGGYGIGTRITSLVWLPTVGMGMALETVVGQNLGADQRARAKRAVYLAVAILASVFVVVGAVFVTFAEPIVALFVEGTGAEADAVVGYGAAYLVVVAPTYVVMAAYHMMNGAFHGAGSTRLSMLIGLTSLWGMRAGAAAVLLLVFDMGATGVWYGIALSNVTAALVGAFFFRRGEWIQNVAEGSGGGEGEVEGDLDGADQDSVAV